MRRPKGMNKIWVIPSASRIIWCGFLLFLFLFINIAFIIETFEKTEESKEKN